MRHRIHFLFLLAVALLAWPAGAQSICGTTLTVAAGDTLTSIAQRCDTTVEELIRLNPGSESQIRVGDVLRLPNYTVAAQPPFVAVRPLSGGPGTALSVTANGFPPYAEVIVRMGSVATETVSLAALVTDADGTLQTTLRLPDTAQVGETYVVVVETPDGRTNARSYGVEVAFEQGRLLTEATIYLIALGDDGASGALVGCGDSLVPVRVPIAPTVAPLGAGLNTLLASSQPTYPGTPYHNPLSESELRLVQVAVLNREAQIALSGELVVGGVCAAPRIQAQLEQMALQYGTVDTVNVTVNGVPLVDALDAAVPGALPVTATPPGT